jgi:hypothetical protein
VNVYRVLILDAERCIVRIRFSLSILLSVIIFSSSVGNAQSQPISATRFQLNDFLAIAEQNGQNKRDVYVAWASGLFHTCVVSQGRPEVETRYALEQCENALQQAQISFYYRDKCEITVVRGEIVNAEYKRALSLWGPWDVEIVIFDSSLENRLERRRGMYSDYPIAYDEVTAVAWKFKVELDGIVLCDGSILVHSLIPETPILQGSKPTAVERLFMETQPLKRF